MNTTHKSGWLVLIAGLLLATPLFAQGNRKQAGEQQQLWLKYEKELGLQTRYAVDMEMQSMGMIMQTKMFRLDGKSRSEMTLPFMNMPMVALELPVNGKPVHYSLFPDKKKYCIAPESEAAAANDAAKPSYKLEEAGTEVYEGVACKKRIMTLTLSDGTTSVMTMLTSPAQKNMPVKIDAQTNVTPEPGAKPVAIASVLLFKNYRFEAPDAGLFSIPKDYTQAANMAEVMMSGSAGGGAFPMMPPSAAGQPGALPADAAAAIRQAQEEAAAEAAAEAAKQPKDPAAQEAVRQGLQGLRGLFGK